MLGIYIALGTNLGDKEANFYKAVSLLKEHGIKIIKLSAFYDTKPYGVTDQPDFLNAVAQIDTKLTAPELLKVMLEIELEMGRVRLRRWGERIIDLDLLLYGNNIITSQFLTVPHPDMLNRDFVMVPLAQIAPSEEHPVVHKTFRELAQKFLEGKEHEQ